MQLNRNSFGHLLIKEDLSEIRLSDDVKVEPEDLEDMETPRMLEWNSNKLRNSSCAMLTEFNGKTQKKGIICSFSTIYLFKFSVRTFARYWMLSQMR